MKTLLITFLVIISTLIYSGKKHACLFQNKDKGQLALDKVSTLPEVKNYLQKYHNRKAIAVLSRLPDKDFKYYCVKVGISDMGMLSTNFNFYIDPKTYQIFYADYFTEQGEQLLTLAQWRKWRELPVWQKWHCYKYQGEKLIIYACKP
jgi:hypothetical protein